MQSQFSNYSIPYMYALSPVLSACTANNHKYPAPVVTYVQVTGLAYLLTRLVATVDYGSYVGIYYMRGVHLKSSNILKKLE